MRYTILALLFLILAACTPAQTTPSRAVEQAAIASPNTAILPQIVGFVFNDANGDGVKQATDPTGLAGVTVSLVPVTSGASGKGAQTTQTVAPEGWYGLTAASATYTLTFTLPSGWRATGPLTRTVLAGTPKQVINLGVQPATATATAAPTAPTPAPSNWRVTAESDDCFTLLNVRDGRAYTLCIAAAPIFRLTVKATATP